MILKLNPGFICSTLGPISSKNFFSSISTPVFGLFFRNFEKFGSFNKSAAMSRKNVASLVAICQMTATANKTDNFETCKALIKTSKKKNAKMVFLPECFDLIGENSEQSLASSEPINGPLIQKFKDLAKDHCLWLSLGGFHEKGPEDSKKNFNSHIIIDSNGEIISVYRKLHLFNVDLPGTRLQESEYVIPGDRILAPVSSPVGNIGLGICYDLRFPEFSISLAKSGAEIITYPSAFTQKTGMAHWETLLRSRAIESQCYVIAAAQTGKHNGKRTSYGHAMVVDPWGCVIACCPEGTNVAIAEIDLDYVHKVRKEMPIFEHRRPDIYGQVLPPTDDNKDIDGRPTYQFGQINICSSQLFYKTSLSMAFVNIKPVLTGHVLVAPLRPVVRMCHLTTGEVADLFKCVQQVQRVIEKMHNVSSSTITVQDGPDAGQSINHVHVHILPRKPGDFTRNDDIYIELQNHDKSSKRGRSEEDMAIEASTLRRCF